MRREDFLQWIKDVNDLELPIIVEGKDDKKALEAIGISNPIFTYHGGPYYRLVEIISDNFDEVIILTDNDKMGRSFYRKLRSEFSQRGVRINDKMREFILKSELNQIEGIVRHMRRLEQ